jgi:3-oxoacyl-[acyl-carrier protein] reductase
MNAEIWNMRLHEVKADALERWFLDIFRSDCMGAVFCTREALQWMVLAGGGSIIYMVSTPALEGYHGSPYTAAKGAVLGLMRDVACEYGRHGIRANALALGNIETPATIGSLDERTRRLLADEAPLGRWGKPQEVADAALFLGSDRSGFITGQTLVVDGGTVRR